jgi:hypothetical protein
MGSLLLSCYSTAVNGGTYCNVTSSTATIFSGTLPSAGSVTTFSIASSDLVYVSASSAVLIAQFSRVCILTNTLFTR